VLAAQAACDSQLVAECPSAPGANYPRSSDVKLLALPPQPSMANPCAGLPAATNPWCKNGVPIPAPKQ
jgi:hypothetical protein